MANDDFEQTIAALEKKVEELEQYKADADRRMDELRQSVEAYATRKIEESIRSGENSEFITREAFDHAMLSRAEVKSAIMKEYKITAYDLDDLVNKGLVKEIVKGDTTKYVVGHPNTLREYLSNKKRIAELESQVKKLKSDDDYIVPEYGI